MDKMMDFFAMVEDFYITVFDYSECKILYMNKCAREKFYVDTRILDCIRDTCFLHDNSVPARQVKTCIYPSGMGGLKTVLYRMEFMNRDAVVVYVEHNEQKEKSSLYPEMDELALTLCKEYYSIFVVNQNTGMFKIVYTTGSMGDYCEQFTSYNDIIDDYCNRFVCAGDRENVKRHASIENIVEQLGMQDIYQITYRMNNYEWRALKYVRLESINGEKLFMAGVVFFDKNTQEYLRDKSIGEILNSFSEQFQAMYRVDLISGELEVLKVNISENDVVYATEDNFRQESLYFNIYVDPAFREDLWSSVSHEALIRHFNENDEIISCNYCEISGKWINMKIIKDAGYTADKPYVIYAIRECTEEMETETRNTINEAALSRVFLASAVFDIGKDSYELLYEHKTSLNIPKKGRISLMKDTILKNIYSEDLDTIDRLFEKIHSGESEFIEEEIRSEDNEGVLHFYGVLVTRIQLKTGNKLLILIMNNDERVATRESFKSLNKEYDMTRNVLYTLGDDYFGMYYFDFGYGIIKTLRLPVDMCDIFENSQKIEDFTEVYVKQMVHKEDREALRQCFSRPFVDSMVHNGKDRMFCEYRRLIDNEYHWVRLDIKAIKIENGQSVEVVYAMKDIHEEREMEIKRNNELMDAIVAANKANKAKSVFLSNMSHDIRTPLNAIIGMTDTALNHTDNIQRVRNSLQKIKSSGKILLYLINNILDMSYIESGKTVINESELSLPEFFHAVIAMVQTNIKKKHLTFKAIAKNVINETVMSDRTTLNKIIINLLGNSIKYTGDYGEIGLILEQIPTQDSSKSIYRIQISDTGIGMSEQFIGKLFEPFEREKDSTVSGIEGTGLGMSITKQLIDLMEGNITVKSELNVGTVIKVDIPLKHGAAPLEKDIDVDQDKYQFFYIENDRMTVMDNIREYVNDNNKKEVIIISSYDKEEYSDELEKLGITKFLTEPVFKSDLINILRNEKERFKLIRSSRNVLRGRKILIVEDNEINIDIISDYLDDMDVVHESVRNGLEAYNRIINDHTFDCILMDVRMPVMDGYEATRRIREYDDMYTRTIPIIAMTANAFADDVIKSKEAGMNDHITKPVDPDVFYATIKKHIVAE